jgi:HKD family nuclease
MAKQHTDLTFFTNGPNQTLLDRFKATLADTHLFDVLVGYFRASGFYQLYDSIEPVEKTRILVGLGIDDESNRAINAYRTQTVLDFESHKNAKDQFQQTLIEEIEQSEEADDKLELGLKKFIEFLKTECADSANDRNHGGNGRKLEIRAFPSRNIHAKVYIGRFAPDDRDYGFVVTGSSNFSYSGLVANREFNVELRQRRDVEYALEQFEELWRQSVDISDDFVDAVQKKTWLNDSITPYELYLKLIYEYLQEDINLQDDIEIFLPEGFIALQYQQQAVQQAIKKLNEHNGVFLADVVGLGKTFIAAQLLQQLKGRILVICPPVLKSYWEESLHDFRVPARVESLGKLEKVIKFGLDRFDYVVVDEAHRFRNEGTRSYADLLDICRGKKVILVTATPLNNTIDDIFAQLKLFQAPKNSTIPGIPNLERFFASLRGRFKGLDRTDPAYKEAIKAVSREIRERILKHVMVRRTRSDVMTYFKKDTESQGLFFPEVQDPRRIIYEFEGELEATFNQTIGLLQNFRYARYIPLLYYAGSKQLSEFERQQQRNVGGFMKGILIKRLESSFYAFRKSIRRFIESYERFIGMVDGGTVYISKDVDVYDLLDNDDIDVLAADQLVSFFLIGPLKKFYCTQAGESGEITFFEAVNLLACPPDTPRQAIPKEYYHWLEMNKQRFALDSVQEEEPAGPGGGRSNVSYIEKRLKDKVLRSCKKFTDADEEFLDGVRKMIAQGLMAKKTAQTIKKAFEKTLDPLELLAILRKHIRAVDEGNAQTGRASGARREIILSGYQIAAGGK